MLENAHDLHTNFDLIVSVNTIEHSHNPIDFLKGLKHHLAHDGTIILSCPNPDPVNVELLFFDHLWSITRMAMHFFAQSTGLEVIGYIVVPTSLGDFHMFTLANQSTDLDVNALALSTTHMHHVDEYLSAWLHLDDFLLKQLNSSGISIFGAGQFAALIRCYAPNSWNKRISIIVDRPSSAWDLGHTQLYLPESVKGKSVILAVHPWHHEKLAARILDDGGVPVKFPSYIVR